MSPEQQYGFKWEKRIKKILETMGYTVEIHRSWNDKIDLVIDSACLLHVKAAKAKKHSNGKVVRNRYQFNFRMVDSGHVILAICDAEEPTFFVIPITEPKLSLNVTSGNPVEYTGWAKKYKNNWGLLEHIVAQSKVEERVF